MDIARTLTEGGKEVVTAVDKRITDVTTVIDTRGAKLAETIGARAAEIDKSARLAGAAGRQYARQAHRTSRTAAGRTRRSSEPARSKCAAAPAADLLNAPARRAVGSNQGQFDRTPNRSLGLLATQDGRSARQDRPGHFGGDRSAQPRRSRGGRVAQSQRRARSATISARALPRRATRSTPPPRPRRNADPVNRLHDRSDRDCRRERGRQSLNRSTASTAQALGSAPPMPSTAIIGKGAAAAQDVISKTAASAANSLRARPTLPRHHAISTTTATAADLLARTATSTTEAISTSSASAR